MGFGDFQSICTKTPLPLCALVGPVSKLTGVTGIDPICYARSIELANTIIFEGATDFMHILALIMTTIMIIHVRSKFTAVGRKEITLFFYLYMALTIISLVLDAGVVAAGMGIYPYFVAVQNGFASALCMCLLVNGFVGYQLYEDGTTQSVWILRGATVSAFALTGVVSILTFLGVAFSPTNTIPLFVVLYILNGVFLLVYVISQVMLVVNTLQDRWPLGDIAFGVLFFVIGQVIIYVFGEQICTGAQHYLDGLFFATIFNLLAVMMVYKYWDSITREDLEFSVGAKQGNWVKDPLLAENDDPRRTTIYQDDASEYAPSQYNRHSTIGDNRHSTISNHRASAYGAPRGGGY